VSELRTATALSATPRTQDSGGSELTLGETALVVAWNLKGDVAQPPFVAEVSRLFHLALPIVPHSASKSGTVRALWLGPTSWLLIAGGDPPRFDFTALRAAVNAVGGALFDLSASYAAYTLSGPRAPVLLAAGCPLDLHPRAFATGECRHTLYGQVPVLIEKRDNAPTFMMLVPRSYARDVRHALRLVAAQYGHELHAPAPLR
jgi:sarcosine oxidase, subunit gamma